MIESPLYFSKMEMLIAHRAVGKTRDEAYERLLQRNPVVLGQRLDCPGQT
jgi:hypothetical protein